METRSSTGTSEPKNLPYYKIDENISESKAREINQKGLIAFIPDKIKMEKFKGMPWIRKLSDLPKEVKI
ncbi:hypothetical protein JGI2_01361 [Candidatus Kryptobacter tengchongensis]|nr:hypothetical protein JGI2_01361 [Candidatus Kryptobacter tengchongensis]